MNTNYFINRLDNAVVNVPPFAVENEACKMVVAEAGGGECAEAGDNGVSDSDSDDLGPETAVDADLDIDDDAEMDNNDPAPPTLRRIQVCLYTFMILA